MKIFKEKLEQFCIYTPIFPDSLLSQNWNPNEHDEPIAWKIAVELNTRITTAPLAFLAGDEVTAVKSVVDLFKEVRVQMKEHSKAHHFAALAERMLNGVIRPFTARWHGWIVNGEFANDDSKRRFRGEHEELRKELCKYGRLFSSLAGVDDYDASGLDGNVSPVEHDLISFGVSDTTIDEADQIKKAEVDYVRKRRGHLLKKHQYDDDKNAVGLALSGGGIRSATFGLGVVQGLAIKGIMKHFDYMSTVSGGGSLGSLITSLAYKKRERDENGELKPLDEASIDREPFDFLRVAENQESKVESATLRGVRNHSKYLTEGGLHSKLRIVALVFYGVLMNMLMVLPIIMGLVLVACALKYQREPWALKEQPAHFFDYTSVWVLMLIIGVFILMPILQSSRWRTSGKYLIQATLRMIQNKWFAYGLTLLLILALAWDFLPLAHRLMHESVNSNNKGGLAKYWTWVLSLSLPVLGALIALLKKHWQKLLWLFAVLGPLTFFALYLLWVEWLLHAGAGKTIFFWSSYQFVFICALTLFAYSFGILNVNFISPHRFYRNRLARTYILKSEDKNGIESIVPRIRGPRLAEMHDDEVSPYHLINTALNAPSSDDPELRGRNSDFFVFSKYWSGSRLTGYVKTDELEKSDNHLDLGTAMAISAAAASPLMGSIKGLSHYRFWLTLLNARLGYWIPNVFKKRRVKWGAKHLSPGPVNFFYEMIGKAGVKGTHLNLSDGGHIENLGVYELLRRRCKYIVAVDGECDPEMDCQSLMILQRYAKIDLGVDIDINISNLKKNQLGKSSMHFALWEIHYNERDKGYLLYIKSSLTGNEPDYVLDYARMNQTFPHQSTGDQLFEEDQFEAYRSLGQHIAEDMFIDIFGHGETNYGDENIARFFEKMDEKLLRE